MRIASLVRAGVSSNTLRRCAAQQARLLGGFFPLEQPSICNSSWERWVHSGLRAFPPWHIWQFGGQQSMQEGWFAKDQKNWASGTGAATQVNSSSKANKVQQPVIYRGPLSDTLRKVKVLSLTSCCLSVITGPAIVFLTSPHLSVILKGGVASAVMMLSASTTAALHWFVGPYVHKLIWIPGAKEVEVEMVTWMATYERRTIPIEDIRPPKTNRPFVTFAVKNKFYFVDTDKIPNKDLLRLVTFYQKQK
eukprot:c29661_g1_i1 orf=58-804(+)